MSFSPYSGADPTHAAGSDSSSVLQNLSNLGLGYSIALAIGLLVLLSSLLLASYFYCRHRNHIPSPNPHPIPNSLALPRVIFVAEEDDDNGGGDETVAVGLDPAAISSYPKFPYSGGKGGEGVCSICLCEYKEGEMLRLMPDCGHYFHLPHIDEWLRRNASCPLCRTSPMPTPLSTPLSEVVPLSQFAADRTRLF
ncbi:RING-H2 finger protein ATL67-like [Typha angustifolia]|uniref:RING-H2 finger protein ATL67-like n=1 Tax=Typha angustifolia TaxID=59011 RepID=UPI003C2F6926